MVDENSDKYDFERIEHLAHGDGQLSLKNKDEYEGSLVEGQISGVGKMGYHLGGH